MASFAARPIFFEGQVLAAADLGGIGDHARARDERHMLHVHRPGIVTGFKLVADDAQDATGAAYKRVFVEPGLAYDDVGREILLDERFELFARRFEQTIGASADATSLYPVILRSDYRARPPEASGLGMCQTTASSRIDEKLDITVGRPESISPDVPDPGSPGPDASPAEGVGPPLLLGFVRWDPVTGQFAGVADDANGVGRRYAGINAATVAGMGGKVLIQPDQRAESGALAVELDAGQGELRFGPLVASGTIADPLVRIDRDGNITAKGTLSGRSAPGTTHYSGGIASDGLILPLPQGVAEDQVESGEATLQIVVSPHVDPADSPDPALPWAALTQECRVDSDRRVHCRIAWMSLDFGAAAQGDDLTSMPGAVSYLLVATIAGAA